MAHFQGTTLDHCPFDTAVFSSVSNGASISLYTYNAIAAYTGADARIIALKPYFEPFNFALQSYITTKSINLNARISDNKELKKYFVNFKDELNDWMRQISNVYRKGSTDYDRMMLGGATSFYVGTPAEKLIRINTLITEFGTNEDFADLKIQVQEFGTGLSNLINRQGGHTSIVVGDSSTIHTLLDNVSKGMWYVYGTMITVYNRDPSKILMFFPMRLIYKAANEKRYTLMVPKHSIRKICLHKIKPGETFSMTNNEVVDLAVGYTHDPKVEPTTWYILPAGQNVNDVEPEKIGDIRKKFIMVKNQDLETSGDITFVINIADKSSNDSNDSNDSKDLI